jgi:protoporphyrinogen oxidase
VERDLAGRFSRRPRLSRIYYAGKFYAYPLKAFEALRNLGLAQSIACLASYAYARAFPLRDPKTFHQWMRNEFGERLYSIFFKTYTEKVWGMDCDEISADWAAQRIKGLNLSKALADGVRRSLGLKGGDGGAKTLIESFRYPRRGPGMMWDAAARKICEFGGRILMDRTFEKLRYDPERKIWTVDTVKGDGTREVRGPITIVKCVGPPPASVIARSPRDAIIPSSHGTAYDTILVGGVGEFVGGPTTRHIRDYMPSLATTRPSASYHHDPQHSLGRLL